MGRTCTGPKWTPSLNQFTFTLKGRLIYCGKDQGQALEKFQFLMIRDGQAKKEVQANPTFATVCDAWLIDHVRVNHSSDRYNACKDRMEEFVAWIGIGTRVSSLRASHVLDWIKSNVKIKKVGSETVYKAMVLSCLNWAAKKEDAGGGELIPVNPLKGRLKLPLGDARGGEILWTDEIYETVLKHGSPSLVSMVKFLKLAGCRPNVARRVEAKHFNPTNQTLDIADLYGPGNKKATKRVWLCPQALELIKSLVALYPSGPLFRTKYGTPWSKGVASSAVVTLRKQYPNQLPKTLCLYGLRHTFATMILQRYPEKIEYLRVLLGHKDYKMILKHYGHLFDQHKVLNEFLASL